MRRQTAGLIVATATLGAVAVGSGITAWANWSVEMTNGRGSLKAAALPRVPKPEVKPKAGPRIDWTAVTFKSGHPVDGYLVVRHTGDTRAEACRVPATKLSCTDSGAVPGSTVTYTVQPLAGTRWIGPASPASRSVDVPKKKSGSKEETELSGSDTADDEAGKKGTEAGTPEKPAVPSTPAVTLEPTPKASTSTPASGSEPDEDEVASSRTVTSGEEGAGGTSG